MNINIFWKLQHENADDIQNFENKLILNALQKSGYNKAKAARTLGLTRSTFRYKLSKISPDFSLRSGVGQGHRKDN